MPRVLGGVAWVLRTTRKRRGVALQHARDRREVWGNVIVVKNGHVVDTPKILRYLIGVPFDDVIQYATKRGWTLENSTELPERMARDGTGTNDPGTGG